MTKAEVVVPTPTPVPEGIPCYVPVRLELATRIFTQIYGAWIVRKKDSFDEAAAYKAAFKHADALIKANNG